jgi:hypothetical protein
LDGAGDRVANGSVIDGKDRDHAGERVNCALHRRGQGGEINLEGGGRDRWIEVIKKYKRLTLSAGICWGLTGEALITTIHK